MKIYNNIHIINIISMTDKIYIFYLLSDIHLEHYGTQIVDINHFINIDNNCKIDNGVYVLLLAGDIGYPHDKNFLHFINSCCVSFDYVFYITGNHEYYDLKSVGYTMESIKEKIKEISIKNFYYLDNDIFILPNDLMIVGTTLWSNIPPERKTDVTTCTNDYTYINDITTEIVTDMHNTNREWLKKVFADYPNKKIVMTHHLPSPKLIAKKFRIYDNVNCCYASNDEDLFNDKIILWCFGHTHVCINNTIDNIPFKSNPVGYLDEPKKYCKKNIFIY